MKFLLFALIFCTVLQGATAATKRTTTPVPTEETTTIIAEVDSSTISDERQNEILRSLSTALDAAGIILTEVFTSVMARELPCTEQLLAAVNACYPLMEPLMNQLANYSQEVLGTVDQLQRSSQSANVAVVLPPANLDVMVLQENCAMYQPWKMCVGKALIGGQGCDPTSSRLIDAIARSACTDDFFAYVQNPAGATCLNQSLSQQDATLIKCFNDTADVSANFFELLQKQGFALSGCSIIGSYLTCMEPAAFACNTTAISTLSTILSNVIWATFDKNCPFNAKCAAEQRKNSYTGLGDALFQCSDTGTYLPQQQYQDGSSVCVDVLTGEPITQPVFNGSVDCPNETNPYGSTAYGSQANYETIQNNINVMESNCTDSTASAIQNCQSKLGPLLNYMQNYSETFNGMVSYWLSSGSTFITLPPSNDATEDLPSLKDACENLTPWQTCANDALAQNPSCSPSVYRAFEAVGQAVCSSATQPGWQSNAGWQCAFEPTANDTMECFLLLSDVFDNSYVQRGVQNMGYQVAMCDASKKFFQCMQPIGKRCKTTAVKSLQGFASDAFWAVFGYPCVYDEVEVEFDANSIRIN